MLRTSSSATALVTPGRWMLTLAVTVNKPSTGSRPNETVAVTEASGMDRPARAANMLSAPWKHAA
ncbi:hypothetical protein D3C71_1833190 [compost metagenome]